VNQGRTIQEVVDTKMYGLTLLCCELDETAGKTLLVVHDLYPSKEVRDFGSTGAMTDTLDQLDELLASLGSGTKKNRRSQSIKQRLPGGVQQC
jgi:hypothetical protein